MQLFNDDGALGQTSDCGGAEQWRGLGHRLQSEPSGFTDAKDVQ